MLKAINLKLDQINELVRLTADRVKLSPAMIEKDFWVSYILDYLFNRFKYKDMLEFKGGTSLSKGYDLIQRFSEDIDVILNIKALSIADEELTKFRSKNQQDTFNKALLSKSHEFLKTNFINVIITDIDKELQHPHGFSFIESDGSISFKYPQQYQDPTLLQEIRLEVGVLAAWTPNENIDIQSFVASYYPDFFNQASFKVLITMPKRTFWEKIVILHKEANRTNEHTPLRYSRHYYDVYQMLNSKVKVEAIDDLDLLREVVDFNIKFYPTSWANFESAKPGTIKLIPSEKALVKLKKDYDDMSGMLYGKVPTFDEIIEKIRDFESEVNS